MRRVSDGRRKFFASVAALALLVSTRAALAANESSASIFIDLCMAEHAAADDADRSLRARGARPASESPADSAAGRERIRTYTMEAASTRYSIMLEGERICSMMFRGGGGDADAVMRAIAHRFSALGDGAVAPYQWLATSPPGHRLVGSYLIRGTASAIDSGQPRMRVTVFEIVQEDKSMRVLLVRDFGR